MVTATASAAAESGGDLIHIDFARSVWREALDS